MTNLISVASDSLSVIPPGGECFSVPGRVGRDLLSLLSERNGFYAFESALHVFPTDDRDSQLQSLESWNSAVGWRRAYGELDPGLFFFAEDLFGLQFGTDGEVVFSFNPETANVVRLSEGLAEWEKLVLSDYSHMTGHSLAHEWQVRNGEIPVGHRLIPRIPFVVGGSFSVENMVLVESWGAMKYWGDFARSVAEVPDGEQFRFDVSKVERIRCARDRSADAAQCLCFGSAQDL
ncbi:hypothetical protein [Streptomyces mirabilis]|uniref:hypothetical protein n=1 Tax=Streptomyces mirabilis TaxID=68239 RepID=UPI0036CC42EA